MTAQVTSLEKVRQLAGLLNRNVFGERDKDFVEALWAWTREATMEGVITAAQLPWLNRLHAAHFGAVRKCPICEAAIAREKLMCLTHWRMVPAEAQMAVNIAWRAFKIAKLPARQLAALKRYRVAHDAAIAAVQGRMQAKGVAL